MLFTTSLTAFAVNNEGSMEVTARIETAPAETTQPTTDGSSAEQDGSSVLTGETASVCVVLSSLLLIASVLVIYVCMKIDRSNSGRRS